MPKIYRSTNPERIATEYMILLGHNVTLEEMTHELEMHPDYPNLLAVSDVMNNFGAEVEAYRVGTNELREVPCPFLAHTSREGQEYVLVTGILEDGVTISTGPKASGHLSLIDFDTIFDGVVLATDKPFQHAANPRKKAISMADIRSKLVPALTAMIVISLILLLFGRIILWTTMIVVLLKSIGVVVSILLLIQSIDRNNPLIQTLCSGGDTFNCNAVLSSRAANIIPGLSWSDVGFFYFAGTWLTVVLVGSDSASLWILAILNLMSLPYTLYSLYYQARIAKQWCLLCCITQILLWLEFGFLMKALDHPFTFPGLDNTLTVILALLTPTLGWLMIKPLVLKQQQGITVKEQLRKFKYNNKVFEHLLKERPKYVSPKKDWSIVLGDPKAENVITMVSNPYCQPCGTAHKIIDQWLTANPYLQFRIIFTADNTEDDYRTPVVRHLMALNQLGDKTLVKHALHKWYEQKQKNYEVWSKSYPVDLKSDETSDLQHQKEWCKTAEIRSTPTFLLNGHILPELYRVTDIKYMLDYQQ